MINLLEYFHCTAGRPIVINQNNAIQRGHDVAMGIDHYGSFWCTENCLAKLSANPFLQMAVPNRMRRLLRVNKALMVAPANTFLNGPRGVRWSNNY